MTLLEVVQQILNDIEGDEVNSISDTWEATQTANIVADVYNFLISTRYYPHLETLFQLESSASSEKPTHMRLPENVQDVSWIKYNVKKVSTDRDRYVEITYISPEDFIELTNSRDSTDTTNVKVVTDFSGVSLLISKSAHPTYFTSFDDNWIVFDSYYSILDTTLQSSKTQVYGHRQPSLILEDDTVIDFPKKELPLLISEAKSKCFVIQKQAPNPQEVAQGRRLKTWFAKEKNRINGGIKTPNYGRK